MPHTPRPNTSILDRAAPAFVAAVFSLAACAPGPDPESTGELYQAGMRPVVASVPEITAGADSLEGRVVIVSGEVNRIFGPRWFSIGGGDFANGEELLVVGQADMPALLNSMADSGALMNDLVQVRGVLQTYEEDQLERQINVDLDGDVLDGWDGKPVVIMTHLDITPRVDVAPAVVVPVPVPVVPITDETIIVDAPSKDALVGKAAALLGVRVQTVLSQRAFLVGPTPNRHLLVVTESAMPTIEPGQTIAVAGAIEAIPSNIASVRADWGLTTTNEAMVRAAGIYLKASDVEITSH